MHIHALRPHQTLELNALWLHLPLLVNVLCPHVPGHANAQQLCVPLHYNALRPHLLLHVLKAFHLMMPPTVHSSPAISQVAMLHHGGTMPATVWALHQFPCGQYATCHA